MEDNKRLNKAISETGYCSRRQADKLIEEGKVILNGRVGVLGDKVLPNDAIVIEGKVIKLEKEFVYLAFNKPKGIVCTTDLKDKHNIIEYINFTERIFPIGRLDKDSEGLIFLTSDGDIVNKILRSGNNHEKEYEVTVDKPITEKFIYDLQNGVPILDKITKKCLVEKNDNYSFTIVLTEGMNRQIRRMCSYFDYEVVKLKRIRIMNIHLDIKVGKWRYLSKNEMAEINLLVKDSSKTYL